MGRGDRISIRGSWPGALVLRQGWAKAHARPWNDAIGAASLRLDRGSSAFLAGCVDALDGLGVDGVLTVPLYPSMVAVWQRAGFHPHRELLLLERRLDGLFRESRPASIGVWPGDNWLDEVAAIDQSAFSADWQLGRLGLLEASRAAPSSVVLTDAAALTQKPRGFAIVGTSASIGYLQRLAVAPDVQGTGLGRDLVMASLRWARGRGARTMLVNTQTDNRRSIALYTSEGFEVVPDRLAVLRAETHNGHLGERLTKPST